MRYRFTKHANEKLRLIRKTEFKISKKIIQNTFHNPLRVEDRYDGTFIASSLIDNLHILRVVYKRKDGIIVIITFYPGRRKSYGI